MGGSKSSFWWELALVVEVPFVNLRIRSVLFVDNVVLLASSGTDLQLLLEQFAVKCEAARIRISISISEAMVLTWERVGCSFRVEREVLLQWEELKYLSVSFTRRGRIKREIDKQIGPA